MAIAGALSGLLIFIIQWLRFLICIGPLLAVFLSFTRIVIGIRFRALGSLMMMTLAVDVLDLIPTSLFAFLAIFALRIRGVLPLLRVVSVVSITVSVLLLG